MLGNIAGNPLGNPLALRAAVAQAAEGARVGDLVIQDANPGADFLPADGATLLQSEYPELFAKVGIRGGYTGAAGTNRTMPASRLWRCTAYGNGVFVALASSSAFGAYSLNGTTWTQMSMPYSSGWVDVVFGNGMFVAITESTTEAAYSYDGISWFPSTNIGTGHRSLAFGGGIFVSLTNGTTTSISVDGINWASGGSKPTGTYSITYGGGFFVGVPDASSGLAIRSADGATWNTHSIGSTERFSSIAYHKDSGFFCAVASAAFAPSRVNVRSADGITWIVYSLALPSSQEWGNLIEASGLLFAVVRDSTVAASSEDGGITWTVRTAITGDKRKPAYGNGLIVYPSFNTTNIQTYPRFDYDINTRFAAPNYQPRVSWPKAYVRAK